MTTTQPFRIISADSHVMEPYDLWWDALGHRFGDRTPRIIDEYRGVKGTFFYAGNPGQEASMVQDLDPVTESSVVIAHEQGFEACGYDGAVRLRFQDAAAVEAEVLHPTRMLGMFRNPDVEVLQACCQVFNDWEAEFVSHNPRRLLGVAAITMNDVDWALKELERTLKKGLVEIMVNCQAPEGCPPYRDPVYDRFWAAAEEAGAPIGLHILTGRVPSGATNTEFQTVQERLENPWGQLMVRMEIQKVLGNDFIFGGILDRFPKLKVVCAEFEASWIPHFMDRMDECSDPAMFGPAMRLAPSR